MVDSDDKKSGRPTRSIFCTQGSFFVGWDLNKVRLGIELGDCWSMVHMWADDIEKSEQIAHFYNLQKTQ